MVNGYVFFSFSSSRLLWALLNRKSRQDRWPAFIDEPWGDNGGENLAARGHCTRQDENVDGRIRVLENFLGTTQQAGRKPVYNR